MTNSSQPTSDIYDTPNFKGIRKTYSDMGAESFDMGLPREAAPFQDEKFVSGTLEYVLKYEWLSGWDQAAQVGDKVNVRA